MFPLSTVLFPHAELPLHVFEPRYKTLVDDVLAGDGEFGVVLITAGSEVGGGDRRADVGTLVKVSMSAPFEDGRWLLVTKAIERIRVVEWLDDDPYPQAMVERLESPEFVGPFDLLGRAAAVVRRIRMLLSELDDGPCTSIEFDFGDDPTLATWTACTMAPLGLLDSQHLLECSDPAERLEMLIDHSTERIGDLERLLLDPDPR
jgi:ATP-dependent Lon protease